MLRFLGDEDEPNFLAVVRLDKSIETGKVIQTSLFPEDRNENDPNLVKFVFPGPIEEQFCFCLTSQTATPTYGYVVTKQKEQTITADCLLSSFFSPDFFRILRECSEKVLFNARKFLTGQLKVPYYVEDGGRVVRNYTKIIFKSLNLGSIGELLLSVLTDCRIIVMGESIDAVTNSCYSILALIYPMSWPGVFIPFLPQSMINTLYAPFPYIVGIHPSMRGALESDDMESYIIIDIDKKTMQSVNLEYKLPKEVQKKVESFGLTVGNHGADIGPKAFIVELLQVAMKLPNAKLEKVLKKYKKKSVKIRRKMCFKCALYQSQVVSRLMAEIEAGPGSHIYKCYFNPGPDMFTVVRESPRQPLRESPRPPTPQSDAPNSPPSVVPAMRKETPQPTRSPAKTFEGTLNDMMKLAESFKSRNTNIEQRIQERRARAKCTTSLLNPENMSFRSKMMMFQNSVTASDTNLLARVKRDPTAEPTEAPVIRQRPTLPFKSRTQSVLGGKERPTNL